MLPRLLFGIEQGTEGGLDGRRSEVRIVTGNQTIARLQFNGAAEVLMGGGKIAGERLGERQRIVNVVGAGGDGECLLQVGTGFGDVARVEQGDAAVDRKSTRLNSSHLGISYAV